jgi:hypothetical protein
MLLQGLVAAQVIARVPAGGLFLSPGSLRLGLDMFLIFRGFLVSRCSRVVDNPPCLKLCLSPSRSSWKLLTESVEIFPRSHGFRTSTPLDQNLHRRA